MTTAAVVSGRQPFSDDRHPLATADGYRSAKLDGAIVSIPMPGNSADDNNNNGDDSSAFASSA